MQDFYVLFLIIHLFCAIIFVGYLFYDVVFVRIAKKRFLKNKIDPSSFFETIGGVISRFMPFVVLLLFISGGILSSSYLKAESFGMMQALLLAKIALASLIFLLVIFSLSCHYIFKCKNPLGRFIHPIVLSIAIAIILLAKLMFYIQ